MSNCAEVRPWLSARAKVYSDAGSPTIKAVSFVFIADDRGAVELLYTAGAETVDTPDWEYLTRATEPYVVRVGPAADEWVATDGAGIVTFSRAGASVEVPLWACREALLEATRAYSAVRRRRAHE